MSRLDELGLKYGTDKASNGHNYLPLYEKHLPKKINKFLEIGCWKGASIKMFKEYYNDEGKFYVMDVFGGEVIGIVDLEALGIVAYEGSQSDMNLLNAIKEQFDVISEDGSHHSDEQVITFKHLFKHNLVPGGVYCLEDIMCCRNPYWWRGMIKKFEDTALAIFTKYLEGGTLESEFVTAQESAELMSIIESVSIYKDSIVFIHKKKDA